MLIFCRHGKTIFNDENKFQGASDSPLTKEGINQAVRLNSYLKNKILHDRAIFYLSPLPRVSETYKLASKGIENELHIEPELSEVCFGLWEGIKKSDISKSQLGDREKDRFNFVHPGSYKGIQGESYSDYYNRLIGFFLLWSNKINQCDTVVIAHLGTMLCAYKYFNHGSDKEIGKMRFDNDEVLLIDSKGETRIVSIDRY